MRVLWRALRARPADGRPRTAKNARRRSLRGQLSDRVWGLQRTQGLDAPRRVSSRGRGRARAFLPPRRGTRVAANPADAEGGFAARRTLSSSLLPVAVVG